ncbi:MAG: hypothetical protein ACOYEV_06320 [Candidatus Nanopelagicales bacterium]
MLLIAAEQLPVGSAGGGKCLPAEAVRLVGASVATRSWVVQLGTARQVRNEHVWEVSLSSRGSIAGM